MYMLSGNVPSPSLVYGSPEVYNPEGMKGASGAMNRCGVPGHRCGPLSISEPPPYSSEIAYDAYDQAQLSSRLAKAMGLIDKNKKCFFTITEKKKGAEAQQNGHLNGLYGSALKNPPKLNELRGSSLGAAPDSQRYYEIQVYRDQVPDGCADVWQELMDIMGSEKQVYSAIMLYINKHILKVGQEKCPPPPRCPTPPPPKEAGMAGMTMMQKILLGGAILAAGYYAYNKWGS